MPGPALAAALEIARGRHRAITAGDYEAYHADDQRLAETCALLAAHGAGAFASEDIPLLDELIGTETQSKRVLETMMAEARASLDGLNRSRHAQGAYGAQERLSVNGA